MLWQKIVAYVDFNSLFNRSTAVDAYYHHSNKKPDRHIFFALCKKSSTCKHKFLYDLSSSAMIRTFMALIQMMKQKLDRNHFTHMVQNKSWYYQTETLFSSFSDALFDGFRNCHQSHTPMSLEICCHDEQPFSTASIHKDIDNMVWNRCSMLKEQSNSKFQDALLEWFATRDN